MSPVASRRAEALKKGLCTTCVIREVVPGCRTCAGCIQRSSDNKKKRQLLAEAFDLAAAWCETCSRFDSHRYDCPEVPFHQRDPGPYLPLQGLTDAESRTHEDQQLVGERRSRDSAGPRMRRVPARRARAVPA